MSVSVSRPYFAPYAGFFYKACQSDILVIMDAVQFPRGSTWITRNRFKNDQGTLWITVPVWKKGLGLQKINDVGICREGRWAKKHITSLESAYANAPYFKDHIEFLHEIFTTEFERLIDLNFTILRYLFRYLQIDTKILLMSELGIHGRGDELLVNVCKTVDAFDLIVQHRIKKYFDSDIFREAGIRLHSFNPPRYVYPQLWGNFIANLSVFDMIFNCGLNTEKIIKQR